jgi:hypothetical protein
MISTHYYPKLSSFVTLDSFPQDLKFIETLSQDLMEDIFVKEHQFNKSSLGESGSFYLILKIYQRLGIDISGTGMSLLINPSSIVDPDPPSTEIPISVYYRLEILKYIRNFNVQNFDFSIQSFNKLILDIFSLDPISIVDKTISVFIPSNDINDLVDDINVHYSLSGVSTIQHPASGDRTDAIIEVISSQNFIALNVLPTQIVFDIYFSDLDSTGSIQDRFYNFYSNFVSGDIVDRIKQLFKPHLYASIDNIDVALEFPRSIFIPVATSVPPLNSTPPVPIGDPLPDSFKTRLTFKVGSIGYSTDDGMQINLHETPNINFPKSLLLGTQLTLEIQGMKLDLSRTNNIPEATAEGRPVDFIGAYITEGTIGFPTFWNHNDGDSTGELKVRNLLVGTGGISGTIGLEAKTNGDPAPLIKANFGGGFSVSLDAFSITFQQNSIVESQIHGTMKIPGFKDTTGADAEINIDVWIGTNGEFSVTASEDQSITALSIPNIFELTFKSVSVGRKNDRFFIAVAGNLDFKDQGGTIGKFLPDDIEIRKLIIWQDGEIEFEGGELVLPKAMTFKLPPVELSITAIGFGSHEQMHEGQLRKYKFFEFSGGISINPGGIDARGDGIKFYYTSDTGPGKPLHTFVRIQGISIDLTITNKSEETILLLKGYLAMKDPQPGNEEAGTEYVGGIEFSLPKLEMGGSAAMRLNPKVPAFLVDINLEIATPIPLGTTGLGIYGFRALLGQRYVASRTAAGVPEDGEWWQYYKAKIAPDYKEGIQASKFDQEKGFSLGAGVSLATSTDSGKAFSSKLFFLLSLPEVFLFQGQAQMLKERIGLDSTNDPPFFAMIAISKTSVEAAFGVNYKMPDDKNPGSIAKIDALIEMGFFFGNASAWYINIGRDLPEERRVNVRLFDLFDSYFYLMLSSSGIRAGAGSKFEVEKKFGPLRAELSAYLDIAGKIAFKPKQYGASIQLGGKVGLYIFKFGFSISVDAGLAGEAPQPFIITGSLKVCIKVLKKDRCAKFEFTWTKDTTLDTGEIEIMNQIIAGKAVNMMTREAFNLLPAEGPLSSISVAALEDFAIPMDSYIDLEFLKGVLPSVAVTDNFGGNTQVSGYIDYVSPQKAKSSQVRHEYHLDDLKIHSWNGSAWVPYDIYEAATPLSEASFVTADLSTLKKGYWQYQQPGLHNKLRIMAQSPLSFISQGTGNIIVEELGITSESIFCAPDPIRKTCIDFSGFGSGTELGEVLGTLPVDTVQYYQGFFAKAKESDATLVYEPYEGFSNALVVKSGATLEFVFTIPQAQFVLQMQTLAESVNVHYYKRALLPDLTPGNLPQFEYVLAETRTILSAELSEPVFYDDIDNAIEKVVIEACKCGKDLPSYSSSSLFCTDITQQAKDLETFLNQIIQDKDLIPIEMYPEYDSIYSGIFQGSSLYPSVTDESTVIEFSLTSASGTSLDFLISDNHGFSCTISLISSSSINWNLVTGFGSIRPYNTVTGLNYEFEIDVTLMEGGFATVSGSSCFPIVECFDDCSLYIYQFCHLSFEDAQSNATLPDATAVQQQTDSLTAGFNHSIQPIWRPNTYYAIEVQTEDRLFKDSETSLLTSYANSYLFAFRTKGPIGYFHEENPQYVDLLSKDREAEFKLANLQYYIDYEKSYPNADGALIKAKPLFFLSPELNLFYLKNYVYEFYRNWDMYSGNGEVEILLETIIKDPAPNTDITELPSIEATWLANSLPGFVHDAVALNNMITNGNPCSVADPISPMGVNSVTSIGQLEPLKLYTAIFNAKYKIPGESEFATQEVHRYVFQTSRYGDFEEQVNSYILETDPSDTSVITKEAKFEVSIELDSAALTLGQEIMNNTLAEDSNLRQEYADDYDKLIDGVFKIGALHPAATTEFNILKDTTSGQILGILVRNPEPFNDPKMPDSVIVQTIESSSGSEVLENKLFSKDKRNLLITNNDLNLVVGDYNFNFKYLQWNGNQYDVKSTVSLTIFI